MGHEAAVLRSIEGATMSLLGVNATGKVNGLLFELAVEQRYRNATAANVEAVYTFPVPWGAALLELEVRLGDKVLKGVVVEKKAAEKQYEAAIDKGDTAIMLERAGDGLCTVNLGNLIAGEEATIRYVYAQTLRFEQGSARLTIPTVIAPRYGNPADAGLQPHQAPAKDLAADYPFALSIELRGPIAKGSLASPSHPIAVTAIEAGAVAVKLARAASLDRDFVLTIGGLESQSIAALAKDGEGYVALVSLCAPKPESEGESPLAVKIVVDCSGSMAGDSIGAAKRALHRILEGLELSDRFSLSVFGNDVHHLVGTLTAASTEAIVAATGKAGEIDANLGGTEMEGALRSVFQIGGADGAADVLLISDGEIMAADSLVAAARAAGQRVFVVAIGSAPAESVLRRLAESTGGACEFVAPNEDVEGAILRTFGRLRSPRIDRVEIAWPQMPRWTTPLPRGLFGGETIHVYAGFDTLPAGNVTAEFHQCGDGMPLTASAELPLRASDEPLLSRMAALARTAGADAETQLRLALDYRLLTDRTNFVVVHVRAEADKATQLPELQRIAQMHAAGWGGVGSVLQLKLSQHMTSRSAANQQVRYIRAMCTDLDIGGQGSDSVGPSDFAKRMAQPLAAKPAVDYGDVIALQWTLRLHALDAHYTSSRPNRLPESLKELAHLRLGSDVMSALTEALHAGAPERAIVAAFLAALEPWAVEAGVSRQLLRALRRLKSTVDHADPVYQRLANLVGAPTQAATSDVSGQ